MERFINHSGDMLLYSTAVSSILPFESRHFTKWYGSLDCHHKASPSASGNHLAPPAILYRQSLAFFEYFFPFLSASSPIRNQFAPPSHSWATDCGTHRRPDQTHFPSRRVNISKKYICISQGAEGRKGWRQKRSGRNLDSCKNIANTPRRQHSQKKTCS